MRDEKGIVVNALSYAYGAKRALDQVTFTARVGQFTALLGPNGAGKSTLISLLTGLFSPEMGRIDILGEDFVKHPRRALASMGVVFQQQSLDMDLTIRQNMHYAAALHGLRGTLAKTRIAAALERMELGSRAGEPVRSLNSGHRRRLEIARAIVHRPQCLILDEPTVGLDVPTRAALVKHVHGLCREDRLTVLWATHLVDEVWPEDDLIVLHQGVVKAASAANSVLRDSGATTVLEAYKRLTDASGGPEE